MKMKIYRKLSMMALRKKSNFVSLLLLLFLLECVHCHPRPLGPARLTFNKSVGLVNSKNSKVQRHSQAELMNVFC